MMEEVELKHKGVAQLVCRNTQAVRDFVNLQILLSSTCTAEHLWVIYIVDTTKVISTLIIGQDMKMH